MEPETDCVSCQIATIRTANRNKHPHTPASHPSATAFTDILHCKSSPGLTPQTTHAYCLILVEAFSRFTVIYGLPNKSTESVINTIKEYSAAFRMADAYGYIDIDRIRADTGSEFIRRNSGNSALPIKLMFPWALQNIRKTITWPNAPGKPFIEWRAVCWYMLVFLTNITTMQLDMRLQSSTCSR